MKRNLGLWLLLLLFTVPLSAQQPQVKLVHLPLPVYPPVAIAARISGQVHLTLAIGPDGTIKSGETISGPPILAKAVTESLPQAKFSCTGCSLESYKYEVTYDFVLPEPATLETCQAFFKTGQAPWKFSASVDSSHHATIRANGPLCGIASGTRFIRARSARCLWLWKCGQRSEDFDEIVQIPR